MCRAAEGDGATGSGFRSPPAPQMIECSARVSEGCRNHERERVMTCDCLVRTNPLSADRIITPAREQRGGAVGEADVSSYLMQGGPQTNDSHSQAHFCIRGDAPLDREGEELAPKKAKRPCGCEAGVRGNASACSAKMLGEARGGREREATQPKRPGRSCGRPPVCLKPARSLQSVTRGGAASPRYCTGECAWLCCYCCSPCCSSPFALRVSQ